MRSAVIKNFERFFYLKAINFEAFITMTDEESKKGFLFIHQYYIASGAHLLEELTEQFGGGKREQGDKNKETQLSATKTYNDFLAYMIRLSLPPIQFLHYFRSHGTAIDHLKKKNYFL